MSESNDHSPMPEAAIAEWRRVLKPGGLLIVDAVDPKALGGRMPGRFEAFWWDTPEALLPLFVPPFKLLANTRIELPWPGQELVLQK